MTVARSLALAIFLMTYLGLALGRVPGLRIDRTGIAIVGAAAAVVTGAIPWDREAARGAARGQPGARGRRRSGP